MIRHLANMGAAFVGHVAKETGEAASGAAAAAGEAATAGLRAARAGAEAAGKGAEAAAHMAAAPGRVGSAAATHAGEAVRREAERAISGIPLPGTAGPAPTAPGTVSPVPGLPGGSVTGPSFPGLTFPGMTLPGVTAPGLTVPGVAVPGPILPGFGLPGPVSPRPPVVFPTPLPFPPLLGPAKTATQLARSAVEMLNAAAAEPLNAALSTAKAKRIPGNRLIEYLERRVRVGEVLQKLANHWTQDTREDFAAAFQLGADKLEVMDLIVAIAILSDPDLEDEIRAENLTEATDQDLIENKQIVWQHPPPGSVLEPPYLILVAVERRDLAEAEKAVEAILRELDTVDGYRLTKAAASRLSGAGRRPNR